jgi:hypothetical protein
VRDGVAAFYDPYAAEYWRRRWNEGHRTGRKRLTKGVIALVIASAVLIGLLAADAHAFYSLPAKVTITQVQWFVGNLSVGNQSGFSVAAGHQFTESVVCQIFCGVFTGVAVGSPFVLVNDTLAYPWFEYANVTIAAPSAAYTGPLTIDLEVGGALAAGVR